MTTRNDIDIRLRLIDQASQGMVRFGRVLENNARQIRNVGLAFTAVGAAIGGAVIAFAKAGDEIQKMAIRTGLSTEALSELRFAAQIAGTSITGLEIGIRRMSASIIDAQSGLMESVRAFNLLGVSMEELRGLDPERAFFVLVEALAGVEDATLQVALAQDIFGRSGTALLPIVEGGIESLRALRREARDLGVVFDQEAADSAAEFVDALTRVRTSAESIVFVIGSEFAPALTALADKITELVTRFRIFTEAHPTLVRNLGLAAAGALALGVALVGIGIALPPLIAGISALSTALLFLAANPILILGTAFAALVTLWALGSDEMREKIEGLIDTTLRYTGVVGEAVRQTAKLVDELTPAREKITKLADAIRDPLVGALEGLEEIAADAKAALDGLSRSADTATQSIGGIFNAVERLGIPVGRTQSKLVDLSTASGRAAFVIANLRKEFDMTEESAADLSTAVAGVTREYGVMGIPLVRTRHDLIDLNTAEGLAEAGIRAYTGEAIVAAAATAAWARENALFLVSADAANEGLARRAQILHDANERTREQIRLTQAATDALEEEFRILAKIVEFSPVAFLTIPTLPGLPGGGGTGALAAAGQFTGFDPQALLDAERERREEAEAGVTVLEVDGREIGRVANDTAGEFFNPDL